MKLLFFSFLLVCSTLQAQQLDDFVADDLGKTNFFNYKYFPYNYSYKWIADSGNAIVVTVDTLNYCRIIRNKIKKIRIYEFKNENDSVLIQTIDYANYHLDTIQLDCPGSSHHRVVKKKKIKVYDDFFRNKKVYKYDRYGYLIECSTYNRGILYKIWKQAIGLGNNRVYYQYAENYTEVTVFVSFSELNLFKSDVKKAPGYSVHTKNANGDLLSVFDYLKLPSGDFQLAGGYKYVYEYD
ncbi:MAG: hypothetical protein JWP12_1268 [Bacteroidetes bacterium]|nr:hypothetical protein [Bacteroidota bacterium]